MTTLDSPPSATFPTSNALAASTSSPLPAAPPPEIESTMSRLSAYRNVRGVMILSRPGPPTALPDGTASAQPGSSGGIVQSTGSVFEAESGKTYARAVEGVVLSVSRAVAEMDEGDELKLMRIRTRRHELIITPDERYLLVVLQDPGQ